MLQSTEIEIKFSAELGIALMTLQIIDERVPTDLGSYS